MRVDVLVVGGGPAGMFAAGTAAQGGAKVLLLEKNSRPGRKLMITGKGRCNVTNNCGLDDFFSNIPRNPRFLQSALHRFAPENTIAFFEERGLSLKTERGNRVFPKSDRAVDVVDVLTEFVRRSGARLRCGAEVSELLLEDGCLSGVRLADGEKIRAGKVIVAAGGKSYPLTGSTGDGYRLAEQAGHTIVPLRPSLVPIETVEDWCGNAQGLSLKNVTLSAVGLERNKVLFSEQGELLFTHFGISGPLVLSLSAHLKEPLQDFCRLFIDLKPALDEQMLEARVLRDFSENANKNFGNSLDRLLPRKLIPVVVRLSGIEPVTKVNQITREQRRRLCGILKALPLTPWRFRPIEEAIVTSGGVDVSEVNPKTMESKRMPNLYFAGEVLDVDGYTGGFNLQIAYSTGYAAGLSCQGGSL